MTRPRAIRTLFVLRDAAPGAETTLLAGVLRHLAREDIEPAVCVLGDGPLTDAWRREFGIPVAMDAAAGAEGRAASTRAVGAAIRATGAQVVHALGAGAALSAWRAARLAALPHVWSQTGLAAWRRVRDVRAALVPARAIVVHTAAAEQAQHRLNPRRVPCRRVTAGVVLPERLREHRRADAREALTLPHGAVVAASLGPLGDPGHELFLRAATSLCNARAQARLLIAGTDGHDEPAAALRRRAAALGLGDRLTVLGAGDLERALDASDIALHPARDPQTLPVALLQAMASGTAVIAFEQPLAREITTHGVDALLTPGTDAEALAVALLALADDPPRRVALAAGAAEAVRIRHDAAVMAADLTVLYRDVAPR